MAITSLQIAVGQMTRHRDAIAEVSKCGSTLGLFGPHMQQEGQPHRSLVNLVSPRPLLRVSSEGRHGGVSNDGARDGLDGDGGAVFV